MIPNRSNQNPANHTPRNVAPGAQPQQPTARITVTSGNLYGTPTMNQGNPNPNFLATNETYPQEYYQTPPSVQTVPVQPTPQPTPRQRRLQVDDALAYLEQVRSQFVDNPGVYNDFLDVMKDFKTHQIDTHGVIRRVSRLFGNKPNLITGFNTFLPPGFHVEVQGSRITITEPSGTVQILMNDEFGRPANYGDAGMMETQPFEEAVPPIQAEVIYAIPEPDVAYVVPENDVSVQQPIQFGQAVDYLNKIKERFANRPEVYRQFLDILGSYQKMTSDSDFRRTAGEGEVYRRVADLFKDEPDLLQDFSSFLPDAQPRMPSPAKPQMVSPQAQQVIAKEKEKTTDIEEIDRIEPTTKEKIPPKKRSTEPVSTPSIKKSKIVTSVDYDYKVQDVLKYSRVDDFVFFEQVRKSLGNEEVVQNFFRCLLLYNKSLISKHELLELITPFLSRFPDLMKYFKELLGTSTKKDKNDPEKLSKPIEQRVPSDLAHQIDYSSCKRLGISYRSLPDSYERPTCSGRTPLCKEILNDTWVSFPSWSSEDTSSVTSKKSQYEDFIYRTEDERFEVDILIEVNKAAIAALDGVQKKMMSMRSDDRHKFRLDNHYGCSSPTLMLRAVKKIYGEHANKVLEGLQKNPAVVVPQVLQRLREKDIEWREAQEAFNKIWREQTEKNYLKSLDHQASVFKINDSKLIRSKALIHQMETIYDDRLTRMENGGPPEMGPHMVLEYPRDVSVLYDVNELVIHHVRRQQNIAKKEKAAIKKYLRCMIPQLFSIVEQELSDDEDEGEISEKNESDEEGQSNEPRTRSKKLTKIVPKKSSKENSPKNGSPNQSKKFTASLKNPGTYMLFFGSNSWLVFIRLHHLLCERLALLKRKAAELLEEYNLEQKIRETQDKIFKKHGKDSLESTLANATDSNLGLRLTKKPVESPENYYPTLIQELKNLMDGAVETGVFEDGLRNLFGIDAYVAFTMDKLVASITRQLQNFVTDDLNAKCISLFDHYKSKPNFRNTNDPAVVDRESKYELDAGQLMVNQNCFKMFFLHGACPLIAIELIDTDSEEAEHSVVDLAEWSAYVRSYLKEVNTDVLPPEVLKRIQQKPVYMMRNVRVGKSRIQFVDEENAEKTSQEPEIEERSESKNSKTRKSKSKSPAESTPTSKNGNGKGRKSQSRARSEVKEESSPPNRPERPAGTVHISNNLKVYFSSQMGFRFQYIRSTREVVYREGAPGLAKIKHREVAKRRKDRFARWLEEKYVGKDNVSRTRNWLAEGCKVVSARNTSFPYLSFNKFVSQDESNSGNQKNL